MIVINDAGYRLFCCNGWEPESVRLELTEKQRDIYNLHLEGMTPKEIKFFTGLSVPAVHDVLINVRNKGYPMRDRDQGKATNPE